MFLDGVSENDLPISSQNSSDEVGNIKVHYCDRSYLVPHIMNEYYSFNTNIKLLEMLYKINLTSQNIKDISMVKSPFLWKFGLLQKANTDYMYNLFKSYTIIENTIPIQRVIIKNNMFLDGYPSLDDEYLGVCYLISLQKNKVYFQLMDLSFNHQVQNSQSLGVNPLKSGINDIEYLSSKIRDIKMSLDEFRKLDIVAIFLTDCIISLDSAENYIIDIKYLKSMGLDMDFSILKDIE